ncbi:MAG: hypothetical protein HZB21_05640 [Deltaproteobacteria bacterium]|nr:hypothetical protein [Deltaproteobacteria bacterium]
MAKTTPIKGENPAEYVRVGVFYPALSLMVAGEMNSRKIKYRLEEIDSYATALDVPSPFAAEAGEILAGIKKKNKRVRL